MSYTAWQDGRKLATGKTFDGVLDAVRAYVRQTGDTREVVIVPPDSEFAGSPPPPPGEAMN